MLDTELLYDPTVSPLGVYPRELKKASHIHTYVHVHNINVYNNQEVGKKPRCLLMNE